MGKLVLLKLGEGSLEQGFPVALQFGEEGHHPTVETIGRLPAMPELEQAYRAWSVTYHNLSQRLRLDPETLQMMNISRREACQDAARHLAEHLNAWLYADAFRPIREKLLEQLMPSDQVRVIVQTANLDVRRLPLHLWDFCDRYPKSEIALGASIYERVESIRQNKFGVNVLAILGNSSGIDTQTDRRLLEQLSGANISFLVEPTRQEVTQELWRQSWDILFFAGHSSSSSDGAPGSRGQIALNQTESLTLDQLKYALRRVVERGLQIAIFNSCDGLGLARELEDLRIPQIIVMREPVPDQVAQTFLKSFLSAFAQGQPFYLAVREAREILQGIEDEYPCATWLPVICQNPAVIPPTWQALGGDVQTMPAPQIPNRESSDFMQERTKTLANVDAQPTLINDRYEVQSMLGRGGFGRTFLAADTYRFGDLCVLKQFAPANRSPGVLQRSRQLFEREAKVLYQINHPQIPKFLAWFTEEDQLFIVEEFIDGKTYLALLEERRQRGETFSEAEIIQWLKDLLPVLDYLHGINIIHRDISPGNVILPQRRSQPVLIDFGIVKEVASQIWSGQADNLQALHQASRVGKPGYAPPEQMQLGQCYPCSDLYGLGMTALVLLTGRNPQWLAEQGLLLNQPFAQPQWHAQVSPGLAQILDKMVAGNPRNRYQFAQAVLADLNALTAPKLSPLPPPPTTPTSILRQEPLSLLAALNSSPDLNPSLDLVDELPDEEPDEEFALSPEFLDHCRRELIRCIGPMAGYIFEDTLEQHPRADAFQLIELLAAEIPDTRQANQFRSQVNRALQSPLTSKTNSPQPFATPTPAVRSSIGRSVAKESDSAILSQGMLESCRRELARQIGPMAHCIMDDILAQSPRVTSQQLIQAILAEIPDSRQAEKIRQQLMAQLGKG